MPKSRAAFRSPTYARWLKPRSLSPPMSVIRPTLKPLLELVGGAVVARVGRRRRGDSDGRAVAPAGKALVHEPRVRTRARDVHDLGAATDLRRRARARRVGDEPPARVAPARSVGPGRGHAPL